ncbi:MAG TPA: 3' terminal RNA ribose 2'-O-methyltransferase Hen1 [Methylomirabilota bacterium]|nr:3' terminal RNA ribose 2'-O-methyltransferase Hen1 [Methylomirabilota bacterium]
MLLELTLIGSDVAPATDLGFLLHKNPFRPDPQEFPLSFGRAHVYWPEVGTERATAALLLNVDPVGLVRRRGGSDGFALAQYVNDRPYAASSFLAVAVGEVYGTALSGRCGSHPELAEATLPLAARVAVVPCAPGVALLTRLFAPLGYEVRASRHPLDERFLEWGEGPYHTLELRGNVRLRDLLAHLTVLVPVLDGATHYYVGEPEVEKLLRRGAGWLATHPERDFITTRYLKRRRDLIRSAAARLAEETVEDAVARLADEDVRSFVSVDAADGTGTDVRLAVGDQSLAEERIGLHELRLEATVAALKAAGARRVLDLGCGEGRLLRMLLADPQFGEIVGVDVSHRALRAAAHRLDLERLPASQRQRIRLLHGALTYRDARLVGFDAAAVVEVIEHLDPWRLHAFERALFGEARPRTVVVTTPNREYNVRWPGLPAGALRHPDHRFEWPRAEFQRWADGVATRYRYTVRFASVGPDDPEVGAPTLVAVFDVNGTHGQVVGEA